MAGTDAATISPDWNALYAAALPQAGYVTTMDVREAGYSSPLVEYHVRTGRLQRVARGIFRVTHFPASEHEDLVIAWLWSKHEGIFSHETALALHELSDVLPSKQHLTLPLTWQGRRLRVPPTLILHFATISKDATAWVGAVPVTTPLRTLADCAANSTPREFVTQATKQGVKRGLFTLAAAKLAIAGKAKHR
jgi:predicted transcriptional regulator of viral defense system